MGEKSFCFRSLEAENMNWLFSISKFVIDFSLFLQRGERVWSLNVSPTYTLIATDSRGERRMCFRRVEVVRERWW